MICISAMLAVFLAWPLVFGGGLTLDATPAHATAAMSASATPRLIKTVVKPAVVETPIAAVPLTCYKRYEIAYGTCSKSGAGCRMQAAEQWDLCEATGF